MTRTPYSAPTFGSLFSGIGGFDLALERAGMTCLWQSEIDWHASAVLNHHWPLVPNYGDITAMRGDAIPPAHVICGGFPCQDLSVAGKRAGLVGQRSGLFFDFVRIVEEMRAATDGLYPELLVIENVPGLFSSHGGADFGVLLDALAECGALDIGWRVLDAQWHGVAQRRRRVFIVVDFRGRRAGEILSLTESLSGDSPPSREAREEVAGTLGGGSGRRGWSSDTDRMTFVPLDPSGAVSSKWAKGTGGPSGDEAYNLVALGFDWYASASQSLTPSEVSPPLKTTMQPAVAYQCQGSNVGEMGTLRAGNGGVTGGVPFVPVAFGMQQVTSVLNRQRLGSDRPCPTLHQAGGAHVIADMAVRRLTPRECERLQGFPDDWTIPAGSDSARYRALGNAVAVPVVERIGRQIVSVLL